MNRDLTYPYDIVEDIVRVQDVVPQPNPEWVVEIGSQATNFAPYRIYNIGHGRPVKLMDYVYLTYADTDDCLLLKVISLS